MKAPFRILLIYVVGVLIFFVAKSFVVPPSFGELGHYRADSIKEVASLQTKIGENYECFNCHVNEYVDWSVGAHKGLSCTSCHGLLKAHAANPEKHEAKDEVLGYHAYPSVSEFCMSCHEKNSAKPKDFPQVTIEHGREEMWNCTSCHNPHDPVR